MRFKYRNAGKKFKESNFASSLLWFKNGVFNCYVAEVW